MGPPLPFVSSIIYRSFVNDIENSASNNRTLSPAMTEHIFFSNAHRKGHFDSGIMSIDFYPEPHTRPFKRKRV